MIMETRPKRIVKRVINPNYHGPQRNDEPTMEPKNQENESFLIEAEEAKYQFILDKMTEEQKAEWRFAMRILKQATHFRSITVKGIVYTTCIWKGTEGKNPIEMRMVVGGKGWMLCPIDRPIKDCLPL